MKALKKVVMFLIASGGLFAQNETQRKFLVEADKVIRGGIEEYIYTFGRVTGLEEAPVFPMMPGRVVSVLKNEGDIVKKGEVIALLDREIPGVKTEYLQITAPIDGIIALINGKVGQMALQNQPFAYIVSEQQAIEVGLSSEDLKRVQVGAVAYAVNRDRVVPGKVVARSKGLDPMSFTGKARIALNESVFEYGSVVKVKIVVRRKSQVLIVPETALVQKGNKTVVYVVQNNTVREVPVEVGIVSERRAEVKGNLKPGDLVVTLGAEGLYDGALVEIGGK
ncbi:MAG: efflux RND transporter periplasmic adaptor subunit [bacterium]|nr:efflux RND transporter periplasmic adaptor subunit [bacterium]